MNDQVRPKIELPPKTCGTCRFAVKAPGEGIICHGVPPTPVLMGSRPSRIPGKVDLQFENIRPGLAKNTPACALYQFQLERADA